MSFEVEMEVEDTFNIEGGKSFNYFFISCKLVAEGECGALQMPIN